MVCLLAGGCPAASNFLLRRQKKVTKEKATRLSATPPFRCGATCGARSSRGQARTRCAQTIARPDPSGPALLGAARRGVGLESYSGSVSREDAQSASSPPLIQIRSLNPSGWAEERRQKRIRARDCLSQRRVRANPAYTEHRRFELLGSDTHFAAVHRIAPAGRAEGLANWGSDPKNSQTAGSPFLW